MAAEVERDTVSLGSLSSTEGCHDSGEEDLGEEEEELELDTKQKHSLTIRVQKKVSSVMQLYFCLIYFSKQDGNAGDPAIVFVIKSIVSFFIQ